MAIKKGLIFADNAAFVPFELERLGYDLTARREIAHSTADADDLLLLSLGDDDLTDDLLEGMAWAIVRRSVNWNLHFSRARRSASYSDNLAKLIRLAGLDLRQEDYPERPESPEVRLLDEQHLGKCGHLDI